MYKIVNDIDKNIFREYDLRGIVPSEINENIAYTIGKSFGSYITKLNKKNCVIAHDNRLSSESLTEALINGILSTGVDVTYVGLCTTPMFYYACIKLNIVSGIMVTASHNPKEYNGFKITFDERGNARGEMISDFYKFTKSLDFINGEGKLSKYDITLDYINLFDKSLNLRNSNLKIVVDPGNGTTSIIAKKIYERYINNVIMINDVSDGNFPNHHPDPSVENNLKMLKETVLKNKADLGISFDGDGDRVGFILNDGSFLPMDKYMIVIIRDIYNKVNKKTFLYDVKCSLSLKNEIEKLNCTPYEYRTGASYTKMKTQELDLPFGGELAGHIYFRDHFPGFDSGLYAGLRLVEILDKEQKSVQELLSGVTNYETLVINKIDSKDEIKKHVIDKVKEYALSKNYNVSLIDGVKVIFKDSWILLRASNTTPTINGRIEALNKERINELYNKFMDIVNKYNK